MVQWRLRARPEQFVLMQHDWLSSVCIVSPSAYGAISGGRSGFIGGIEWQTSLTARWLAARGHQVSLLTWDEGGPSEEVIDGVRVIKTCRQKAGLKGVRFFYPKWANLTKAMRRANADLYYQNGSECTTGQVALWCARNHKPFVFVLASDADCHPALPELSRHERVFYRLGLKMATKRVSQTATQAARLREVFGADSTVIPMPCPRHPSALQSSPSPSVGRVLWIGRVCQVKRPDRLLELARGCPDLSFDLVGPLQGELAQAISNQAKSIPNLILHGGQPREKVHQYYAGAALLCCTSDYEGFPNTFLEAWSHGLPVVSTFDPDGVIVRHQLGVVAKTIPEMQAAIKSLLADQRRFSEISKNARRYFLENHEAEAVLPRFEALFVDAVADYKNGKA